MLIVFIAIFHVICPVTKKIAQPLADFSYLVDMTIPLQMFGPISI